MFLYDDTTKLYKFSDDHVKKHAEELKRQGSHWNETQLQVLLQAITYPIEGLLDECIKHNEVNRSIYILNSMKKVNSFQQDNRAFADYMLKLHGYRDKNNFWLSELTNTISILYRLCLGWISEIVLELNLYNLQGSHFITREQKQEVQKIIADQLTLVLDVIEKNIKTSAPTLVINPSDNNFSSSQQKFFSNLPKSAQPVQSKIEFKTQEAKPLLPLQTATEVHPKPAKAKNKHNKHRNRNKCYKV